jgi:PAS domain S-box-containing protein
MHKAKVMIVEDDPIVGEDIRIRLNHMGYEVTDIATSGMQAIEAAEMHPPDIALMDIRLGEGMNGIETATELKRNHELPVIYLTAFADDDTVSRAKKTEPYGYIVKPIDDTELRSTLEIALYKRRSDQKVRESQQWLQTTLLSIGDGMIATDAKGIVAFMNPVAERLTGWRAGEATGMPIRQIFHIVNESTRKKVESPVDRALQEGVIVGLANHTLLLTKDGRIIPIADSGAPIKDNENRVIGAVLVFRDQTEERRAQQAIAESERKLSTLLGNLPGIAYRCLNDPLRTMHFISEGCEALTGYAPSDLIDNRILPYGDLIVPEDRERVCSEISAAVANKQPFAIEYMIQDRDQTIKWLWEKGLPVAQSESEEAVLEGFITDITTRKTAENRVVHLNQVLRAVRDINQLIVHERDREKLIQKACHLLVENRGYASALIMVTDTDNRPIAWAQAGLDDHFGELCAQLKSGKLPACADHEGPAGQPRIIQDRMATCRHCPVAGQFGEMDVMTIRLTHSEEELGSLVVSLKSGLAMQPEERRLFAELAGDLGYALHNIKKEEAHKASERQLHLLERHLAQAQKMEAIGTLAGGIAHDFNNILSSIIGYTELSMDNARQGSRLVDHLNEVLSAGMRAKELVRQILTFARQTDEQLNPIQIDSIAKEVLKFMRSSIPSTIEIRKEITEVAPILGSPIQAHQILMNLCTNAIQAMEKEGGTLCVQIKDTTIGNDTDPSTRRPRPGAYIKVSVSDTGSGIPPEVIDSIFEPYFTTKPPGEGTGMGLALVHGIVESYGGLIQVDSVPGEGTRFDLWLPATTNGSTSRLADIGEVPGGNERILLVDDEAAIVEVVGSILKRLGYTVTALNDSMAALNQFRGNPDTFDLVITDMTMPHMTGDKLAAAMLELRPELPIILCTGYSKGITEVKAEMIGIKALVFKPIAKVELANLVRTVLDGNVNGRSKACILIIDDEIQFRKLFIKKLARSPYEIIEAENGNQGLALFREHRPDLVVTDLVMPEKEGIETIIDLKKMDPAAKIIAVSGGGRNVPDLYLEFARKMGVKRAFPKPFDWEEMLAAIHEQVHD